MEEKIKEIVFANNGWKPKGMTFLKMGQICDVKPSEEEPPVGTDKKKFQDRSITNKVYKVYLKVQRKYRIENNLIKTKEVVVNGIPKSQVFSKREPRPKINENKFEVTGFTTNPYGDGVWCRYTKKDLHVSKEFLVGINKIITKNIKPKKYNINIKKHINNKMALFIYGADKHIGALTKENSIYKNNYDKKVIRDRIFLKTINVIEEWVKHYNPFESLYIFDLGDAVDGFNNKTTRGLRGESSHSLPQQLNNKEQCEIFVNIHKELFDTIYKNKYAKNVYFISSSNSNHSGDFEFVIIKAFEMYLNTKYPDFKTFLSTTHINHLIYGKHCIIFAHGKDDEDMKRGLPLYLNDKVEKYIQDYICINNLHKYIITFVSGDLHRSAESYGNNFRYKKVLSQYGSSKWVHSNFGSGSSGLSSEVYNKNNNKIYKLDTFFGTDNLSNTGIPNL